MRYRCNLSDLDTVKIDEILLILTSYLAASKTRFWHFIESEFAEFSMIYWFN